MDTAARTYVDFVPPHNFSHDPASDTLTIDLSDSGFSKEHLRVLIDNRGKLTVRGERHVAGNQWSRFRKDLQVSENLKVYDISARLEKNGLLHITMPRLKAGDEPRKEAAPPETGAQKASAAAAQAVEEKKEQKEESAAKKNAEAKAPELQDRRKEEDGGGRGGADEVASSTRAGYGFVKDWRKLVWTLFAVVAFLVGAGLYAKYSLMEPSAEPPADNIGLVSDY